jgi:ABC-type multidrug transport system fused ATPase/permease subunit
VFDDGRLVQDGNHEQLIAAGGVYRNLYASWQRGTTTP